MPINNITQTISELPAAGRRGVDVQSLFVTKQEDFQDHLQGTTVTELNALVVQQNTMAVEMNSTATQVNTNANTATTKAGEASTSASSASTSASEALTSRNQAETFKNSASTSASTATTKASEASASALSASTSASQALTSRNQAETFAQQASASALSVDVNNIVRTTGDETIDGIKTFIKSPVVPAPINSGDAVNKAYVDMAIVIGTNGAYGLKWNQYVDTYQVLGATNRTQIQRNMKRCVLKDDGTVNYYLDLINSTLKANGTPAVLTGADGNVMVEVPKFWYKHTLVGDTHEWWVSDKALAGYSVHPWFLEGGVERPFRYYRAYIPTAVAGKLRSISGSTPTRSQTRSTFRTQARANGTGWGLCSWNAVNAIQLLFLTEYCTFNTQAVLGTGNDGGNDYGITTGQSNSIGNASSGVINNNTWMSYRGIENWYADCWEFIDGINIQNYKVFLNQNPATFADDVFTGDYVDSGVTLPAMSASYIKQITGNFLPTNIGGSSSTFVTDGGWSNPTGTLVIFGGSADVGLLGGGFAFIAIFSAVNSYVHISAGLSR